MATATTTVTSTSTSAPAAEQTLVYGCVHVESILKKHGERVRQEYDSAMSVVIQAKRTKAGKVKMCQDCMDPTRKSLMCFTCPYVGCTRKGHFRRHYRENMTHRLSIDCDTGNIYCHVCDDFIYDPTLEAIQRSKRIILGKRKRDAEEVPVLNGPDSSSSSSDISTVMQIVPPQTCKIAGLRGIQNLGNTCYMSSILQSFIHNPIVRNHYLSDAHHANLCTRPNCIHCTINTVFSSMYSPVRPDPAQAFGPTDFISTIWKIDNTFAGTDQQDSHEFLMFLLNAMHSHHYPESPTTMATNGDERRCKCLAHQVFGGESQSQVTCRGCGTVNRKVEMMFDIGLQIRGKAKVVITLNGKNGGSVKGSPTSPSSSAGSSDTGDGTAGTQSLQDCLDKYTSAEHLDQSQYTCSNCSTSTGATKQMSIKVLPNVLCLQLKRFDGRQAKVDEHVRFPITLDMTPYTSHTISNRPDNRDCTYDLFAVVSHIGANIHKGHYINYAKFNGEWFVFNDHIVEWISEETVLRSKAYLCFYIKHCLEYEYDETLKGDKGQPT